MAGPRGYHSYRGRSSKGKLVLAVLLVLVILASVGFMMMQKYIVYDETGTPKLVLPEKTEESQPPEEEEPVNITIQEQEKASLLQAVELGDDPADWTAELAAAAVKKERLADRYFINKADDDEGMEKAANLAVLLGKPSVFGSLHRGEYKCL